MPWLETWFEGADTPSLIVHSSLEVLRENRSAREFLETSVDLALSGGALCARRKKDDNALQAFLADLGAHERRSVAIGQSLLFGTALAEAGPIALRLRNAKTKPVVDCVSLKEFGITQAEQRVLVLMIGGMSVSDIARELEKSPLTIRTHAKHLYEKLGVTSKEQMFGTILPYVFYPDGAW